MKVLFDAASLLRKAINKSKTWNFTGSFSDAGKDPIPEELTLFCRWLINGTRTEMNSVQRSAELKKQAPSLLQTIITMCLTNRHRSNMK